jgi:hypothetical protein
MVALCTSSGAALRRGHLDLDSGRLDRRWRDVVEHVVLGLGEGAQAKGVGGPMRSRRS